MRENSSHRTTPYNPIQIIDLSNLTQQQGTRHRKQAAAPVIAHFTEEAQPEVFSRVRGILLASSQIKT